MTCTNVVITAMAIFDVKKAIFSEFYHGEIGQFIDHMSRRNSLKMEFLTSKMAIVVIKTST